MLLGAPLMLPQTHQLGPRARAVLVGWLPESVSFKGGDVLVGWLPEGVSSNGGAGAHVSQAW